LIPIQKTCPNGHQYHKTSNGPVCPIVEQQRKPEAGFLFLVAAPARRALENAGITTLEALSEQLESNLLQLHGLGPSSIPKLRGALEAQGLSFNKEGER